MAAKTKSARTVSTLKRAEGIHFAEVGDEFFVTLEDRAVVACINPAAFTMMENLDGFTAANDLAGAMSRVCKARLEVVKKAVNSVCKELKSVGFLEEVKYRGTLKKGPFNLPPDIDLSLPPAVVRVWQGRELAGGLFVNSEGCDIHVIVPNVTDGPIKTCPPHTCTVPAGLFTAQTIIRTFDESWFQNFKSFKRTGFVHFRTK